MSTGGGKAKLLMFVLPCLNDTDTLAYLEACSGTGTDRSSTGAIVLKPLKLMHNPEGIMNIAAGVYGLAVGTGAYGAAPVCASTVFGCAAGLATAIRRTIDRGAAVRLDPAANPFSSRASCSSWFTVGTPLRAQKHRH